MISVRYETETGAGISIVTNYTFNVAFKYISIGCIYTAWELNAVLVDAAVHIRANSRWNRKVDGRNLHRHCMCIHLYPMSIIRPRYPHATFARHE